MQASYIMDSLNSIISVGIGNLLYEDPLYLPDSLANDFDHSYRTWGSQFWYVELQPGFKEGEITD